MAEADVGNNVNKVCRLCLSQDRSTVYLFTNDWLPHSLPVKIKECVSLDVSRNDGLPQNVCDNCAAKLNEWYEFKNYCKKTDESLRHSLYSEIVTDLASLKREDQESKDSILVADFDSSDEFSETDEKPLIIIRENETNKKKVKKKSKYNSESKHLVRGRAPKAKPICLICNQKFNRFPELIAHQSEKHDIKADDNFNEENDKIVQELEIKKEEFAVFRCHLCKKEFDNRDDLRIHCKDSHDTKIIQPYPCSHCDRQFASWGLLVIHERKHTGDKPFSCDICGKKNFISQTSLRRHKLIHLKVYSCHDCNKDFNCDSALKAHIRCKHTDERPYLCNVCGRSFSLSAMLAAHLTSHSTERKYVCDICGFASKTSGNHYRHKNTHNQPGLKVFHCEQCGKSFDSKLKLSSHQIIHRSNRPHVCTVCGKGFLYNNKLERHLMLVHERQRPYSCQMCDKKLASKFGLGIHMKTHYKTTNTGVQTFDKMEPAKLEMVVEPSLLEMTLKSDFTVLRSS